MTARNVEVPMARNAVSRLVEQALLQVPVPVEMPVQVNLERQATAMIWSL